MEGGRGRAADDALSPRRSGLNAPRRYPPWAIAALLMLFCCASASAGIRVRGNQLVAGDGRGRAIRLLGLNRSGTEYSCFQGYGFFDGPSDPASIRVMKSWRINAVRLPLNEDCWLGINGVRPRFGGRNYRRVIHRYVQPPAPLRPLRRPRHAPRRRRPPSRQPDPPHARRRPCPGLLALGRLPLQVRPPPALRSLQRAPLRELVVLAPRLPGPRLHPGARARSPPTRRPGCRSWSMRCAPPAPASR